mgnify:CR=1 FL=1
MSMIQKIQPQVTNAAKKAYQYLGPDHVFSAKEIKEATELAQKSMRPESVKAAEYFSPRALIDSVSNSVAHETVDKAVVGQKLDIVEGHMFG